jgi:hypothetical protein
MMVARNFDAYKIYGIVVNFKEYAFFNAQKIWGAPAGIGQQRNFGTLIPQGYDYDAVDGRRMRRLTMRYQSKQKGDPMIKTMINGGIEGYVNNIITNKREIYMNTMAYVGVETFGLNGYFNVTVSGV